MALSKSFEDYLEAIYLLELEKGSASVKEIAISLDIKLPSVSEAIRKLSKLGLVNFEKYGKINLTKMGLEIAKGVYKKHKILLIFLKDILRVNKSIALKDACEMEHALSSESLNKLEKFVKKEVN